MSQPELSIIIPAYQEAARIEDSLSQLGAYLKRHRFTSAEVVLVIADSPDGTFDLAAQKADLFKNFRIVRSGPKVGKGHQVRIGMIEATGRYKLFMDADLATPLYYIGHVQKQIEQGADVIIAVRDLTSSHKGWRKLLSSAGNLLVQGLLLPGIKDTQCGFKAFSEEAVEELFRRQTILGWGFDMEILAIARSRGYKIVKIEVPDWSDKPHGTFEAAMTAAALETLIELLTILWRRFTGRYRNKTFNYDPNQS